MNFNKNRSDRATEIKIDKSEQIKDNKKGFRIIIENLDTGERITDARAKAIIGAYAEAITDEGVSVGAITVASCETKAVMATVDGLEKVIEQTKKNIVEKFFSSGGGIEAPLKGLIGGSDE